MSPQQKVTVCHGSYPQPAKDWCNERRIFQQSISGCFVEFFFVHCLTGGKLVADACASGAQAWRLSRWMAWDCAGSQACIHAAAAQKLSMALRDVSCRSGKWKGLGAYTAFLKHW